jgi:hypothetical protein
MQHLRVRWLLALPVLVLILARAACGSAPAGTGNSPQPSVPVTPPPTATTAGGMAASLAWSQYGSAGAIQIWVAASGGAPRLLATIPATGTQPCPLVSARLPMPSPDGRHLLVGLGQQCDGLILDPGPLAILDATSGHLSYVPLPYDATVLPQVRSYGWVDNQTIFAIAYSSKGAYLYTLDAPSVTALEGLQTPLEGVVRGSTLFYLSVGSGSGGIQSNLRRYDLTRHAPLPGSISLGAYASCSECPAMVSSPGWDVSADGSHVVYQFTIPNASGGITSSQIFYAGADGSAPRQIAQYLATDSFIHLRLAPDGLRVAITAAFPSPTVVTACVGSPGTKGDPCFVTYTPDAVSMAAWAPDGSSFVAATVDASYGQPTSQPGALIRYTPGTSTGRLFASGGYSPWSSPEATSS